MFTGNKDTDILILHKLDDEDLLSMRLVNKYLNNILSEDIFWLNKILFKFNLDIDILNKCKGDMNWLDYYKELSEINSSNCYNYLIMGSIYGRLDKIIIALNNGAQIHAQHDYALRIAFKCGYSEIVEYLIKNGADNRVLDINFLKL